MSHVRTITVTLALVAAFSMTALAAPKPIGVQEALDRKVKLELKDAKLTDVMARLGEEAGAKFTVDPITYDYLPYGDQTKLNVTLDGYTLREALTPLLIRQGLTWTVDRDEIHIGPSDTLFRMNRRASFDELATLGKLHTITLQPPDKDGKVIDQLRKATGREALEIVYRRSLEGDSEAAEKLALKALPGTPVAYLNMLCDGPGWSWHLREDSIVIIDAEQEVNRQLRRKVTLKYSRAKLMDILVDLTRQARVQLTITPGVMNMVPPETRDNFNLTMGEASIREALEMIAGATGLQFDRDDEGIVVKASEFLKAATTQPAGRQRSSYFVQIPVKGPNGTTIMLFVRTDDLPEDVREKIEAARDKYIVEIREMK